MAKPSGFLSRRKFLKAGALATAAGMTGLRAQARTSFPRFRRRRHGHPPNILFFLVDEQRYPSVYESADLRRFRTRFLTTQNTLQRRGTSFDRHHAASAACSPSRASLYTGQYPSLHGVTNTPGAAKTPFDPDTFWLGPGTVPTLGHYFRAAGYQTFWKGKWHASEADLLVPGTKTAITSYTDDGAPDPEKQDWYDAAERLDTFGFDGWIGPEPHGTDPLNSGSSAPAGSRGRDVGFADQAIALIQALDRKESNDPWLIMSSFVNPHDIALWGFFSNVGGNFDFSVSDDVPVNLFDETLFSQTRDDPLTDKPSCQLSYRDSYHEWMQPIFVDEAYFRFYYQLQENVDQQIGRVYRALRRSSFGRNTVVIFTSDHGDMLGSHGDMHQKWYQAYEETLHVPLTVVDPRVRRRKRVPRIGIETSHADVLPTLLGLAGLDAEALRSQIAPDFSDANPLVGRNLSGLIQGREDPADHEEPVFFMTDDDPSRGPDQDNFIGIARASVIQPNHIETVIARLDGRVWKYSRYFDNPQFWSAPGTPGDPGVMDVVDLEIGSSNMPTAGIVPFERTVKTVPECTEYEMYDVSGDPLELSNLAGDAAFATERQILEALLEEQCLAKRSMPSAATGNVSGQPDCSSEDSCD